MKYLSLAPLLGGACALTLAISALVNGNWLSAVALAIASILFALRGFLGTPMFTDIPILEMGAAVFTLISFIAVFDENNALRSEDTAAHSELLMKFTEASASPAECANSYKSVSTALYAGVKACALQDGKDLTKAVPALKKAEAFGPTLSVVDGIINSSGQNSSDSCYESYLTARSLCPEVVGSISAETMRLIRDYESRRTD